MRMRTFRAPTSTTTLQFTLRLCILNPLDSLCPILDTPQLRRLGNYYLLIIILPEFWALGSEPVCESCVVAVVRGKGLPFIPLVVTKKEDRCGRVMCGAR